MNDIDTLQSTALAIPADAPTDALVEVLSKLDGMKARIRDAEKVIKARVIEVMQEREIGRIDLGDGSYWYIGTESDWDNIDVAATLEALLEHNGGDVRGLADFLASGGLKPGACRKALPPEKADVLFVKVQRVSLKSGKPERKLIKGDERFLR